MDNSISIDLEGTHSRESLMFHWIAYFKDFSKIEQFEENKENKFELVQNKFDTLSFFILKHKILDIKFIVDLNNGLIAYGNVAQVNPKEKKNNIRLIYFRKVTVEIGEVDLKEQSRKTIYYLGFQYNLENNQNRKILLQIDEQNNFIILGE